MITYKMECGFVSEKDLNDTISSAVFYLKDVNKYDGLQITFASIEHGDGVTLYDGVIKSDVSLGEKDIRVISEIAADNRGYIKFVDFE